MMRYETSAEPERARWPRLAALPRRELRSLLPRGYGGFTQATAPRHPVLPATPAVPPIVKILDPLHRPPAFVMGAHGSYALLEGDCAPSYLEVWLAPLGAYGLLGPPMDHLSGQIVDLTDVLGAAGRRLRNSSARRRPGAGGLPFWTSSCSGGSSAGRGRRRRWAGATST